MKIIAHRGASGVALENTLSAIKQALKLNVDAIEFDIRRTKDNQLVLLHDNHTGNVANKKVWVHGKTLKELKTLTLNDGQKIATLKDALKIINGKKHAVIDIKDSNIYEELIKILSTYPTSTVSFTGLQVYQMQHLTKELPKTTFYVQGHHNPFEVIYTAQRIKAAGISLNAWLMNPLTYLLARRANLNIRLYTVNHPAMMLFMRILYPGIEVFTDHADRYAQKTRIIKGALPKKGYEE